MKKLICIEDRVFFNKRIYEYGDVVNMEEDLAKKVNPAWFEEAEEFNKKQEKIVKKINTAKKEGKSVKEVIEQGEAEKREMAKEYEAKIKSLEKQLNPKVKNGI